MLRAPSFARGQLRAGAPKAIVSKLPSFPNHQTILFLGNLRESAFQKERAPGELSHGALLNILSTFFFQKHRGSTKLLRPKLYLAMALMPLPPKAPDRFPLLEHAGVTIESLQHYGFSTPVKGIAPRPRMLFGARNPADGERHWRGSYEEIVSLIDRNFAEA